MRHVFLSAFALLIALPAFAEAKTGLSVAPFTDKTEKGRCAVMTNKAKADLDTELRAKLIAGLMELKRFQIQEREVRQVTPQHSVVGTVRTFEVCAGEGRGQKVEIALEVALVDSKGGLTHMFSSSAVTSSAAADRAPQMAMNAAISEIIKRVDDAVPRRAGAIRLVNKRRALSSSGPLQVKMIPQRSRR